jgi:hypothetical protein
METPRGPVDTLRGMAISNAAKANKQAIWISSKTAKRVIAAGWQ